MVRKKFFRTISLEKPIFIHIMAMKDESIMKLVAKYRFEALATFVSLSNYSTTQSVVTIGPHSGYLSICL